MRNKKLLAIPGIAALAIGAVVGCSSGPPAPPTPGITSPGPVAPTQTAPPPSIAPAPAASSPSAFLSWYGGAGAKNMVTVQGWLSHMEADASNGNQSAVQTDGSQLAAAAQTAAADPLPVDTAVYVTAMNDLVTAGNDASAGDYNDATTYLQDATTNITAVTTVIQGMAP